MPAADGVHDVEYGALSEVPTIVVPTRKSTRATVALPVAAAVAVIVVGVPSAIVAPVTGAVNETVGTEVATVTATAGEVTKAPFESVTRAVNEAAPNAVGVQFTEKGAVVAVSISVVPTKNSTFVTVAGATGVEVAVSATATPSVTPEPAVGLVMATLGAVTFTFTTEEVTAVPFVSVTLAVRAMMPAAVGIQLTEKGAARAVPTTVVPARKSTRATVAPPAAVALAVRVLATPRGRFVPLAGSVTETVGTLVATVTLTADDAITAELESVTRAVSETRPAVVGVQFNV
jgi:hypothetical protein